MGFLSKLTSVDHSGDYVIVSRPKVVLFSTISAVAIVMLIIVAVVLQKSVPLLAGHSLFCVADTGFTSSRYKEVNPVSACLIGLVTLRDM